MSMSDVIHSIKYSEYEDESELGSIQQMAERDLSEPYSIFTYRYFLINWPHLCICAYIPDSGENTKGKMIGVIICKASDENGIKRGYIAMLIVDKTYRKCGIGMDLSKRAIDVMVKRDNCEEILLETELINKGALSLYEKLGFVKEEFLPRYYLNGSDAYRLRLCIHNEPESEETTQKSLIN